MTTIEQVDACECDGRCVCCRLKDGPGPILKDECGGHGVGEGATPTILVILSGRLTWEEYLDFLCHTKIIYAEAGHLFLYT